MSSRSHAPVGHNFGLSIVTLFNLLCCEHKELAIGCWRTEERVKVYLNINSKRGGAIGMKDGKPSIIVVVSKVLAEKGYAATTLREIAREAQAGIGLVHYLLTTLRNDLCMKLFA